MPRKYDIITELYRRSIDRLSASPDNWMDFLRCACRNYRLHFDEQLLVFAQRPDATAVLEIDGKNGWNEKFGRWVNKNAVGIAVFDRNTAGRQRIKYYFDISDTHESRFSRPVPIWKYDPRYEAELIEALENRFGELTEKKTLLSALYAVAKNTVEDNVTDYLSELLVLRENSFLEEVDNLNVEVMYRNLLENSVAYMLLVRCGFDPEYYFEREDFKDIINFNTLDTINALGVATSDIAERGLSAIALTVRNIEKDTLRTFEKKEKEEYSLSVKETNERSTEYGTDIHSERRISPSQSSSPAGVGGSPWEIRIAPQNVSEKAPQNSVHQPSDNRKAERAPDGSGQNSKREDGFSDKAAGTTVQGDGRDERIKSDEMGDADEQHKKHGGGDSSSGTHIQLIEEAGSSELPALLDEKLILAICANPDNDLKFTRTQIELYFSVHIDEKERAEYIKNAYPDRYTEMIVDGLRVGYKPQGNGLLMWEGAYLSRTKESVFSWGCVAAFTADLIRNKKFGIGKLPPPKKTDSLESQQISLFDPVDATTSIETEESPQLSFMPRFEVSQQIIDETLCIGGSDRKSRLEICAYFMKDKPIEDNEEFLKKHYGENGIGFYSNGQKISVWYNTDGLYVAEGETVKKSSATLVTWEDAARRIRELLDMGRYMPQIEIEASLSHERKKLADTITFTAGDLTEEAKEKNYLPLTVLAREGRAGYPDWQKNIAAMLTDRTQTEKLAEEWEVFAKAHAEDPTLLRFRFYRPFETLQRIKDQLREHLKFTTTAEDFSNTHKFFITKDEIDRLIIRSESYSDYRLSVYAFFRTHFDQYEREKFIRDKFGTGGGSSGGDGHTHHDGKGFAYSRGDIFTPYAKVSLTWRQITNRIKELIAQSRFLSDKDRENMPDYERHCLAILIHHHFYGVSDEHLKPYMENSVSHYWENVEEIKNQLTNPVRVEEIYTDMMLPVWESTTEDDRYYERRKAAMEAMRAYREGTYSVFGLKKTLEPISEMEAEVEPEINPLWERYTLLREKYPEHFILLEIGDFIQAYEKDAEMLRENLGYTVTTQAIDNVGTRKPMTGLPTAMVPELIEELKKNGITTVVEKADGQVSIYEPYEHTDKSPVQERETEILYSVMEKLDIDGIELSYDDDGLVASDGRRQLQGADFYRFITDYALVYTDDGEVVGLDSELLSDFKELAALYKIYLPVKEKTETEIVPDNTVAESLLDFYKDFDPYDYRDNLEIGETDEETLENLEKQLNDPEHRNGILETLKDLIKDLDPDEKNTVNALIEDIEKFTSNEPPNLLSAPKQRKEKVRFTLLHPEIPSEGRNDFHITDAELGIGTPTQKYETNVAAIRLLKKIEDEDRLATKDEQEILSRYVGWGGLADCFNEHNSRNTELLELLTPEEYSAAKASSLTAFYTSPVIINAIYKALGNMGFKTGNILEPACGIGNFIGMIPEAMKDCKAYGVELDSISGRIARQLYQNANIAVVGFEKVDMPDSFFDVAVGNVPFGDFKVVDRKYDKHRWLIHDYFFGKTLDKVRPGGIIAFITSKGTLDKKNLSFRKYLAQRADLIGAIRLPNNAFKKNAGTEVTSDIIFLQKRDRITDIEPKWVHLNTDENGITMNSYFVDHPEMILGDMVMTTSQYGMESSCRPYENADLSELLREAVANLHAQIPEYEVAELEDEEDHSIAADPSVRNFSYTVVDGKIYFRENSRMYPANLPLTTENRARGMIVLRDCVRQLIEYQSENYPDDMIKTQQEKLNTLYDDYVKKYGRLFARGNKIAFSDDSSYCLLCSLEVLDDEGNFKRKADMFSKRTIKPHEPVTKVDTSSEALAVSISEKASVDLDYMAELSGKTKEELITDLRGVIFRDIHCPVNTDDIPLSATDLERYPFVTADEYLSGNVRQKLKMVNALCKVLLQEKKTEIEHNISALEAVQPEDLSAGEISVHIGTPWIPVEIYRQFMFETFGTSRYARDRMTVLYSKHNGHWNISNKSADSGNIKSTTTYGTKRVNAYHILEQTLNQKDVRVFDIVYENGKEKSVLNKKETAIAQDRQELIKQKFIEWIWRDIDRREMLCKIYNETYNSIRPREYDGKHIRFSGMNPEISLREHQINAIAHIMYGGNTLLAHEVGAGKTFEIVAAAMEMKRLGLCNKSMIVVPNHITEQWAAEWHQLYPAANVLVATERDFERQNRRKLCARIATGDYDAIIIGHSQLQKIPMSTERQKAILQRQIDQIIDGIREAKDAKCENFTVKQLERTRKSLEARLEKLNNIQRDDVVTFEELGVDRLFIDESHYFKNLFLATKMRNVGGIAQTEAQKSSDLFMKCQYLDEITGNRGVIFATGTPISNSMVELYTIQRYLQYGQLEELNLMHFDDWAGNYGETTTTIELSPEGSGYRPKTRFSKFINLPELMSVFKMCADIQTADMLKLPVPEAVFHNEVIKPSEMQKEAVLGLADRAEKVRAGSVDSSIDNMLKITNDGRKLALDMRLFNPLAPDDENGKVSTCAKNVFEIWDKEKEERTTQLVFCDLSTPKGDGSFNVYDDLRQKLLDRGIPGEEIAYIHDANTEAKKKELFAKVRSGQVRILMGSTAKMGAGTNVQDRLIALHDLDCPWRPSDLAQRLGRIVRQGNKNSKVDIFRYVTEGTFDAYLYQLVENKQKFIAQIMTSKTPVRVASDVDETALNYAEIKALATGNPMIIQKCTLDMEVGKLNMLKANYLNQKYALEDMVLRKYPAEIRELTERVDGYEKDIALASEHPKPEEGFVGMELSGLFFYDKEAAGRALIDTCTTMTGTEIASLGSYRGFALSLSYDGTSAEYRMTLKGSLSHSITLSADVFGNIKRMDNAIDGLPEKLEKIRTRLEETKTQLENARLEMEAPFSREEELAEKTKRLQELNVRLNLNEKEDSLVDNDIETEQEYRDPQKSKGVR